jgi:putative hydrolase of HD superfamily
MNQNNIEKFFDFLNQAGRLKDVFRYNEKRNGIKESVADHSWRLALMVFTVGEELNLGVDFLRSIKIALVHDIAESITGDIDAVLLMEGKVMKEEKEAGEEAAMKKIKNMASEKIGSEIYDLWNEYEEGQTREARFIKALDKLETLTHLAESGYKTYDKPDFIPNYADESIKNFSELLPVLKMIKQKLKEEFIKGGFEWKEKYDGM